MCNRDIKNEMKSRGVRQWQVAECMNISESVLSKMMRHELDPDTAQDVRAAIDKVVANSARAKAGYPRSVIVEK